MWSALLGKKKEAPKPAPSAALRTAKLNAVAQNFGPPLVPEETGGNLSVLEKKLNGEMKCPAGKNQVFIRSLVVAGGTTPPRIALKCHLRKDVGLSAEVYYTHIREVCCGNPEQCPAYMNFKDRFVRT